MESRQRIGYGGVAIGVLLFLAAATASFLSLSEFPITVAQKGIALPSPPGWIDNPLLSWLTNICGVGICAVTASLLNKRFNFIKSTDPVLPAVFLVMTASIPWINQCFCTSTLLCFANLVCMWLLFTDYKSRNSTQETFVVATILSVGTMVQYSFALYIPAWIIAIALLNTLRWREIVAFIFGIIAPYWIVLGLGIISPDRLRLPEMISIFNLSEDAEELIVLYVNLGITLIAGLAITLNNSVKLYAGNKQIYALNSIINLIGIFSITGMVADYTNLMAYVSTFYFTIAVQVANMPALGIIKRPRALYAVIIIIYSALYCLAR